MGRNSRLELNICARLGSAPLNNSVANGLYSVALQLNRMYPCPDRAVPSQNSPGKYRRKEGVAPVRMPPFAAQFAGILRGRWKEEEKRREENHKLH